MHFDYYYWAPLLRHLITPLMLLRWLHIFSAASFDERRGYITPSETIRLRLNSHDYADISHWPSASYWCHWSRNDSAIAEEPTEIAAVRDGRSRASATVSWIHWASQPQPLLAASRRRQKSQPVDTLYFFATLPIYTADITGQIE